MIRWRYCLVLAVLLLLPARGGSKLEEDDDDDNARSNEEDDDGDDNDDDDEDDEPEPRPDKAEQPAGRRAPAVLMQTTRSVPVTRTTKRRPLECFVCAYKSDTPLRACLDPTKYRVHTMTCHDVDEKCFTSVISKGSTYEAVVRGCRPGCVGTPETTCCELNRCNNQAFAMPTTVMVPRALVQDNKSTKSIPPTVLFFVTILLLLQTVVKVAIV